MDLPTALSVFKQLEAQRVEYEREPDYRPPMFDVRLDASADRDDERTFRVRVSAGTFAAGDYEPLRFLIELASEHDLAVEVQNAGFELR